MRDIFAAIAMFLIFGLALVADGLMDKVGPIMFLTVGFVVLSIAGVCVALSNLPERRK